MRCLKGLRSMGSNDNHGTAARRMSCFGGAQSHHQSQPRPQGLLALQHWKARRPWGRSCSCAKEKSSGVEKLRTWWMISQAKHRGNRRFYIMRMATILKHPHIWVHISTLPRNREMFQRNYT